MLPPLRGAALCVLLSALGLSVALAARPPAEPSPSNGSTRIITWNVLRGFLDRTQVEAARWACRALLERLPGVR